MKTTFNRLNPFLIFFWLTAIAVGCTQSTSRVSVNDFTNPTTDAQIHTWWHWLDGNITKEGITKDLEAMKEQGIVQATILNVGLFGDRDFGIKKVDFGTPEWYEMFHWALQEANRLGIAIGTHNCDGWSTSGGPWITPEMSMKQFVWTKTIVNANQNESIILKQPMAVHDFYQDVAVVAFKSPYPKNSFQIAKPNVVVNNNQEADILFDGCTSSAVHVNKGNVITFTFEKPFPAEKIVLMPRRPFMWSNPADFSSTYSLSASDDNKNYKKITEFTISGLNGMITVPFEKTTARSFRLSVGAIGGSDSWIPFTIAECELLPSGEKPMYADEIEYLQEKTGTVKAGDEECIYSQSSVNNESMKEIVDLTSKMDNNGVLNWQPEKGDWTIIRFGYTTTGATNAPATQAGIGLECDKMDKAALDIHFNHFPARLIEEAGEFAGNTFKFMLIDSWEAGFQNWTSAMMKEFEQRRGYSLTSYIPLLCGESTGDNEKDEAVLYDFRQTISELIENNYYRYFGELLHKNNIEFHAEVIYGGTGYPPLDILRTTQPVDLPMFEFWTSTNRDQNVTYNPATGIELNMPSFAVTGYDKKKLGSEAYTGMAHYSETPAAIKPFGDRAWCAGINQMILHSYVHQPNDKMPGMTLGQFGSHFNRNNSYWPFLSEWFKYQSRIQHILQQGTTYQDVLYYLGDQLPQYITRNKSNTLPFGYQFNACNFDILKNRISIEKGRLVLNGKTSYALLSMPPYEVMNFETLKLIGQLVDKGIILYAPKPQKMLSLNDINNHKEDFNELANSIWGKIDGKSVVSNSYGKGKVYWGIPLAEILEKEKIYPDVNTRQEDATNLMFLHKKVKDDDVYFLMNQQNHELSREVSFRVTGKTPEIWDPEYGSSIKPAIFSTDKNYTTLPVQLKPNQTLFFIFRNKKPEQYIQRITHHGAQVFPAINPLELQSLPMMTLENNSFVVCSSEKEGEFELVSNRKKNYSIKCTKRKEYLLHGYSGKINFNPAYTASIPPVEFSELQWLTTSENPHIKYFSGTADYALSFSFSPNEISQTDSLLLDIGAFESIAGIKLNGKDLGSIWNHGTCIPVNGLLQEKNLLEVTVGIIHKNRFIGDFIQYGEVKHLWTSSPIESFLNKDLPLKPSGLKGPVKILVVQKQMLE
ncbi:MAG: glycosyl hydrolase [Mariniphaga sp.]